MSRAKRQQRRRAARDARKRDAAAQRSWTLPQAVAAFGGDEPDETQWGLDPEDPAVEKFLKTGMKSTTGKFSVLGDIAIPQIRRIIHSSGVCEPLDEARHDHPGVPSRLRTEALLLGGVLSAWDNSSLLLTDVTAHLASLPDDIAVEVGAVTADGEPGVAYRTVHKQQWRLLDVLHRREVSPEGEILDVNWLERTLIPASIPAAVRDEIEAVAVDETAVPAWHVEQHKQSQAKVNKQVKRIYRERNHGRAVPEMSSPQMRAIAAEIGVPIGDDGRIERTPLNPAARKGYRTPTEKQRNEYFTGFGVHNAVATRSHILSRNKDDATLGSTVPPYITAVMTAPANTNPGPIGHELASRTKSDCPNLHHIHADQGYSRKATSFSVPLRCDGIRVHMGLPEDASDKPTVRWFNRRDNNTTLVIEYRGVFYHRFTPTAVFTMDHEHRKKWAYVVHSREDDGSIRFRCPFSAPNQITNRALKNFKGDGSAEPVKIPEGVTDCCDGICSIVASPAQLARYQEPHHGTKAHTKIVGQRNTVEGTFGTTKNQGGYAPANCRLPGLEPQALNALCHAVARNVQITLTRDIAKLQEKQKQAKARKQARRSEQAARHSEQNPNDLPRLAEPHSEDRDTKDDTGADADEASSPDTATPPRAPP